MLNVLITSKLDLIKIKLVTLVDLFRQSMTKFFSANNNQNAQQKPSTEAAPSTDLKLMPVSVNQIRFDFLDGFRGLCAFCIIVVHSAGGVEYYKNTIMGHMTVSGGFTQSVAIPGFFLLSSFLLTYRLTHELIENTLIKNDCFKIISKYFIRRFFRIYLPFVFYCTCVKWSPSNLGANHFYPEWSKLVTLTFNMGDFNHLWTIPIEINYYFFIPIISMTYLALYRTNRRVLYVLLIVFVFMAYRHLNHNLLFHFPRNPFVLNLNDFRAPTFSVFLCGSLLAFLYLTYEKDLSETKLCKKIISSRVFQMLLNLVSISMIIYCFRSEYLSNNHGGEGNYIYWYKAGFYWSITLFLLLLSTNEYSYGRMFFNINLMKKFGIYSYGIYLWHPTAIKFADRIKLEYKLIHFKNAYEYFLLIVFLAFSLGYLFFVVIENNMIRIANHLCKSSYLRSHKQKRASLLPVQNEENNSK